MKDEMMKLAKKALIVAIIGGIVAYLVTTFLGPVIATGFGQIFGSIILLVLLLVLAKKAKIDDLNWFHAFVLIFAVGVFGSLLSFFVPYISAYVLSVTNFTLTGLMWTVLYVMVAEIVAGKYMK